ncbi:MAG: membrane integrity-associated transporter subunit PqiC [Thermodesulfobacteriota bacterium]
MKRFYLLLLSVLICSAAAVSFSGCATTQPSRFYTLQSLPDEAAGEGAAGAQDDIGVGIDTITLPALLDRPQIVLSTGDNELTFAEFDRWAEPLDENIYRVVTENISILLNTGHVYTYPWKSSAKIEYRVAIDVIRFDVTADGDTSLVARWTVYGGEEWETLLKKKSRFTNSADSTDFHSLVSALNKTLEDFSREVAEAIQSLSR